MITSAMSTHSIGSAAPRTARARVLRAVVQAAAALALLLAAPGAFAEEKPAGEPVRWDQQRVAGYAKELAAAVHEAKEAVRKSPLSQNVGQRQTYYELLEDMRIVDNSARYLSKRLEKGMGRDETKATFDRIGSLRLAAEETGRRALIEESVMDALVRAGGLHNRMKPYYYGKN